MAPFGGALAKLRGAVEKAASEQAKSDGKVNQPSFMRATAAVAAAGEGQVKFKYKVCLLTRAGWLAGSTRCVSHNISQCVHLVVVEHIERHLVACSIRTSLQQTSSDDRGRPPCARIVPRRMSRPAPQRRPRRPWRRCAPRAVRPRARSPSSAATRQRSKEKSRRLQPSSPPRPSAPSTTYPSRSASKVPLSPASRPAMLHPPPRLDMAS